MHRHLYSISDPSDLSASVETQQDLVGSSQGHTPCCASHLLYIEKLKPSRLSLSSKEQI